MTELNTALLSSEGRLASLLSLSADWVWEQDAHLRLTYFSNPLLERLGIDPQALLGTLWLEGDAYIAAPQIVSDYEAKMAARQSFRDITFGYRTPNGQLYYVSLSGEPIMRHGVFHGYRGVGSDVTQRTLAEQQVLRLARHDQLTGLPNRNSFIGEVDRALARARRNRNQFALLFIDLDGFKNINDTLGHAAGDELLKIIAQRLCAVLRACDTVARIGGDEFVALLEDPPLFSVAGVADAASRVLAALHSPLTLDGVAVQISGSIGISLYPTDGESALALLKNADAAMYLAKASGKNNFQFGGCQLPEPGISAEK